MLNKGFTDRAISMGVWAWIAILKDEKLSVSGEVALKNLEHDLYYFSENSDKGKND